MRFSTLVLLGLVAGCGGGEGVDLEVTSDVAIDRIELFIATKDCFEDNCQSGVGWSRNGAQMRPQGDLYYIQLDEDPVFSTTTDGDAVVLRLQAEADFAEPKVIAIVGLEGGVPVAFNTIWYTRIPQHSGEHWTINLKAADRIQPDNGPPAQDGKPYRVDTWHGVNESVSRCLAMQKWDDYEKKWKGTYVVPYNDPDCDGHTELECAERVADFEGVARCIAASVGTTSTCRLGTRTCKDGTMFDIRCLSATAVPICMPSEICTKCATSGSIEECARDTVDAADATVIHASCHFSPDASTLAPCATNDNGNKVRISLPTSCTALDIWPIEQKLSVVPDGTHHSVTTGGATVMITTFASVDNPAMCTINLSWSGGVVADFPHTANFVLAIANGTSIKLVPLELNFDGGVDCNGAAPTEPPMCATTGGIESDSLWQCGL
jgi:hypothetical protein